MQAESIRVTMRACCAGTSASMALVLLLKLAKVGRLSQPHCCNGVCHTEPM